ncbi:WD40-repeat-containing domain protein [Blakeslea trispora]|nr:WD40-repeat-containing domain protein [Blakeslea trispora]
MTFETICLINKELPFTPYDSKWIPLSSRLCVVGATGEGAGKIAIYGITGKHLELKHEAKTSSAIRCSALTGPTRQLATGDFEGQLQIWDTERLDIPLVSLKAHESIINSIDSFNRPRESQKLVTGSRDGTVKVWDTRQPEKAVLTIRSKTVKDIWAVAFGWLKEHQVIAVGYENGDIKLFDLHGHYLWETHVKEGVCSIDFSKTRLLVSTLSAAYWIDLETGKTTEMMNSSDTGNTLWAIRHIPQQPDCFAIASGDGQFHSFQYPSNKPFNSLSLSKHPVISIDWHKDKKGLFACSSFDQTIKIGHTIDL